MTTNFDFDHFYNTEILPLTKPLEKEGKTTYKWGTIGLVAGTIAMITALCYFLELITDHGFFVLLFCAGSVIIISIYKYKNKNDHFSIDYKEMIVRKIIAQVIPNAEYLPKDYIASPEYDRSCLFRYNHTDYWGQNYIRGTYKGVSFHCSQIWTQTDSGGSRDMTQPTIFNGLFFVGYISEMYEQGTYAWISDQFSHSYSDEQFRLLPMPDVTVVSFKDPEFDKHFIVSTTDISSVAYFISAELRKNVMELIKYLNRPVTFSFVNNHCFVAIPFENDFIDINQQNVSDIETIKSNFDVIGLIPAIIDCFGLEKMQ